MDPSQLTYWNLIPFKIDPTLITIFGNPIFTFGSTLDGSGLPIRYYGLMYLAAFFTCFKVIEYYTKKDKLPLNSVQLEGLATWIIVGVLIGGRFGYIFFYNFTYFVEHPFNAVKVFEFSETGFRFLGISGMSYHGGLIGAFLGGTFFLRKNKIPYWPIANIAFLAAPLGYTWGRIGNFLNSELYGRETDAWIGMVFPSDKLKLVRHPSQLYEAFFEGVFLFIILLFLRRFKLCKDHMIALYLIGYGIARFFIEYYRQPDAHLGLDSSWIDGLSRGQLLCAAMVLTGLLLWIGRLKYSQVQNNKSGKVNK